jgi:hypothetical protein
VSAGEVVQMVAGLVATGAALGALYLAYRTVREARAARREERLRILGGLVVELGHAMYRGAQGSTEHLRSLMPLLQGQLATAIGADRSLPWCEQLTLLTEEEVRSELTLDELRRSTEAAVEEVGVQLERSAKS